MNHCPIHPLRLPVLLVAASLATAAWAQRPSSDAPLFLDGVALDTLDQGAMEQLDLLDIPDLELNVDRSLIPSHILNREDNTIPPEAMKIIQARMTRATQLALEKNWSKALVQMEQALALEPRHPELLRRCAIYASLDRQFGLAEGYFRRVAELMPNEPDILAGWAATLIRLDQIKEARQVLMRARRMAENSTLVHFNLLVLDLVDGKKSERDRRWDVLPLPDTELVVNWLDADRRDVEPHTGADGYRQLTRLTVGLDDPDQLSAYLVILRETRLAQQAQDLEGYRGGLDKALALVQQPSLVMMMERARVAQLTGEDELAHALIQQGIERYPHIAWSHYNHGFLLLQKGQYTEGRRAFIKTIDIDPELTQARFALACAYAGEAQLDKAWKILEQLTATYPDKMPAWMDGDSAYLQAIRQDPRYAQLESTFVVPPPPEKESS